MQTALITGISSGIGFHLAVKLALSNMQVFGLYRDKQRLQKSFDQAQINQPKLLTAIQADITNDDQIDLALKDIATPDLLVNNAGYGLYGPFEELTDQQFKDQFETNFFSPLKLIRRYLPTMRQRKSGRILNVASILGQMVIPTGSGYCSSKWAIEAASEAIRYEVAPFGIEVCIIEPGLIRTDFKSNMELTNQIDNTESGYRFLNKLIQTEIKQYGRFATDPSKAADSILRLLKYRKLPARYRIGADATLYSALKKLVPESLIDLIQRGYLENLYSKDS
ncbi:MAG: SDR family oxidoreductase [Leptonema sp. (in: Bacteria)]|nr:SDR family oxidoreductase [Leptonema sp. (in: bacteria)]